MPLDPDRSLARPAPNVLLIAVGILLGLLLAACATWLLASEPSGRNWMSRAFSALTGRTLTIDVSQPTVVNRIQKLQRLETVVYTMDKIVTGEKDNPIFPDFLTGDRLLMLVHGEVVAGIDFSTLKPSDVHVEGRHVELRLPAAQVLTTRLDSTRTRVYSRQTGLLVPTDPNLETQVRQEAEHQILEAALSEGILRTAQQNASSTITSLLESLGFDKIDFN
jgi:Protein of unknown function (DUF4230)